MSGAHLKIKPFVALAAFFLAFLQASLLLAGSLRTEVSARQVGVGESFTVQITAVEGDDEPTPESPRLTVKGKATVMGPSVSSQKRLLMKNFNFQSESSVVARYTVTPTEVGKLIIGPGTFVQGGRTLTGETIVVEVVKEPTRTQRNRGPFGRDPFSDDPFFNRPFGRDPFSDLPPDLFPGRGGGGHQLPEVPKEYLPKQAPSDVAFLHATISKKRVVLGEPVTLTIIAYGARGDFRELSPNGPSLGEFLSHSVVESSHDEPAYGAVIDGREYLVRKLKEYVLIPLRTGELTVGEMSAVLRGTRSGYPASGSPHGTLVKTPPLTITVVPTPESGKPEGYFPGDVGRYRLTASVTPETITESEYVEVTVVISGQGQVPSQVILPEENGLVWGKPTAKGEPQIKDGVLQGSRVLRYPLQITKVGEIDLGSVELPYFDHRANQYRVAKAELGRVRVTADRKVAAKAEEQKTKQSEHAPLLSYTPRKTADAYLPLKDPGLPKGYWWVLWSVPLLLFFSYPVLSLLRQGQQRLGRASEAGPGVMLKKARRAAAEGQSHESLKWTERALHEAITTATGIKARGLVRAEIPKAFQKAGLSDPLAAEILDVLDALFAARYGEGEQKPDEISRATEVVVRRLRKVKPKKGETT